jgi:membrane protein
MAFYQFLAIFPSLLVLLALSARVPALNDYIKSATEDLSRQVLPAEVSRLFQEMVDELSRRTLSSFQLISVCAGALWAEFNGTWAMIYGLNTAYEVKENRAWWRMAMTIGALTLSLAVTASLAMFLILSGAYLQAHLQVGMLGLRVLEWLVLAAAVSLWFGVLYRFAPNLRRHEWRWSTPGTLCALALWLGATFAARFYFEHVDNYSRSYGHLNGVVMLLLWLYVANGAILIGGEMNSEIEKAAGPGG